MTSYFRRRAAQCYRAARASTRPHLDYEAFMLRGHYFKERAVTAAKRLGEAKGSAQLTGAKSPLRPKHVWAIRSRLSLEGRTRDLAVFNLAIGSELRG